MRSCKGESYNLRTLQYIQRAQGDHPIQHRLATTTTTLHCFDEFSEREHYGFDQEGRQDGPINTIVIGPLMNLF
jgi:hypothetical protein